MTAWRGSGGIVGRQPLGAPDAARSSAIGATTAFASVRSAAGETGNTAPSVPAAAQTSGYRPRSGSITTRTGRACPIGGMPPIVKPVRSVASRALARRTPPRR